MKTVEDFYRAHLGLRTAITPHLETIRGYADGFDTAVEFGVGRASSSAALLMAVPILTSYDLVISDKARELQRIAGKRWDLIQADTLDIQIPICDVLFLDSLHTYRQVKRELMLHAVKVRHRLIFHDTLTFGTIGASGETGRHSWLPTLPAQQVPDDHLGIRPAIDEFMVAFPEWRIVYATHRSHGLLVLDKMQ